MKTHIYAKKSITLLVLVLLPTLGSVAWAYPPDNAAVLYYRAFSLMERPGDNLEDAFRNYCRGRATSNEQIEQFLQKQRQVIDMLHEASKIEHCDWGIDYSKGPETLMPELSRARQATFLLIADIRQLAQSGSQSEALERSLAVYRMARHVGDGLLISHLVEVSMRDLANQTVTDILSQMQTDEPTLVWLRNAISEVCTKRGTLKAAFQKESETMSDWLYLEGKPSLVRFLKECDPNEKGTIEKIQNADETFFELSRRYWQDYMATVQNTLELPFAQAYEKLDALEQKLKNDAKSPDGGDRAFLTVMLSPALEACLCLEVKDRTYLNALKAALELYLIKARAGQLPQELPPGLPKDLFSDKDFEYQKTKEGFVLRCRAKDPSKDQIYEFPFKVK